MSTINLEEGDEKLADEAEGRTSRRRRRAGTADDGSTKSSSESRKSKDAGGSDLSARLRTAFGKIADQLDARNDEELATAIRDEADPMATGLVSLTRSVTFLRGPLVVLVALIEPVLAFARVGRILFTRFMERRQRKWEEANQTEEQPYAPSPGIPDGYAPDGL